MHDQQPITFLGTTGANSETEKTHEFNKDGVITGFMVGTEVGQEFALQNYATLIRSGGETNLWESLDKTYLAGNGRDYRRPVRYEFEKGDTLVLRSENQNTNGNSYHHAMVVQVDYETTTVDRILHSLGGGR